MGGHGTTIGGAIVDSGKFDWAKEPKKYPMLNEPDPSYHGVVYTEALGPAAFIGRCRVVPLRNTGAALSPHSAFQIMQGLETLGLRIKQHCENALTLAKYLENHDVSSGLITPPYLMINTIVYVKKLLMVKLQALSVLVLRVELKLELNLLMHYK